ncbi:MAG: hypothetical protein RRY97_04740, partial [Oscillibacter sp.]
SFAPQAARENVRVSANSAAENLLKYFIWICSSFFKAMPHNSKRGIAQPDFLSACAKMAQTG